MTTPTKAMTRAEILAIPEQAAALAKLRRLAPTGELQIVLPEHACQPGVYLSERATRAGEIACLRFQLATGYTRKHVKHQQHEPVIEIAELTNDRRRVPDGEGDGMVAALGERGSWTIGYPLAVWTRVSQAMTALGPDLDSDKRNTLVLDLAALEASPEA